MPLPLDLDNGSIAGAMAGEFVDAAAAGGDSDADASHRLARLLLWVAFITMILDGWTWPPRCTRRPVGWPSGATSWPTTSRSQPFSPLP
ncbi:unnamed protein product [Urochloa humidicola]